MVPSGHARLGSSTYREKLDRARPCFGSGILGQIIDWEPHLFTQLQNNLPGSSIQNTAASFATMPCVEILFWQHMEFDQVVIALMAVHVIKLWKLKILAPFSSIRLIQPKPEKKKVCRIGLSDPLSRTTNTLWEQKSGFKTQIFIIIKNTYFLSARMSQTKLLIAFSPQ